MPMTPEQEKLFKKYLPDWEALTPDETVNLCATLLAYLTLRLKPEYTHGITSQHTLQRAEPPQADALDALDALASCDSILSLYYYRGGNAMFNQAGMPDKPQVGDAIAKARQVLNASQYYEKKMQAHKAKAI